MLEAGASLGAAARSFAWVGTPRRRGSDLRGNAAFASSRDAALRLRLGTPRAWRALPWVTKRAGARQRDRLPGSNAAPSGSDLCGNAAFEETLVSKGLYNGLAALSAG